METSTLVTFAILGFTALVTMGFFGRKHYFRKKESKS